ncbi:hypothetical protein AIOL_001497 [Candidatus Rhodobacter oscarellae]|uniref:Uncharacterized protein n=1 Tax=Candidatus Rhodobacter oscarellae TaxID=1675527 RepID=A0A0J9GSR2_9RHOB|nr:hypothetical protein AIOL_001497 [Candidatus Rhodobacter lobularis]
MLAGFAAIVLIGVAAHFGMQEIGFSSQDRSAGSAVRLE